MYYGQWEGVHRMTIGGPRLKRLGTAALAIVFLISGQIPSYGQSPDDSARFECISIIAV